MAGLKKQFGKHKNKFIYETVFSFSSYSILTGALLIGFALSLGANKLQLGIIAAIPLIANLLQFFSAFILEVIGTKKWTTIVALTISRLLWLFIVFIAFGVTSSITFLMAILLVSSLLIAVGNLSLLSWTKDSVPTKHLSDFLGKKNSYAYAAAIFAYIVASLIIDKYPTHETFGKIFLVATIFGLLSSLFLLKVPERKKKIKAIPFAKFKEKSLAAFKDKNFRPLLVFGLIWGFAVNISGPFYLIFMLDNLSLGFTIIAFFFFIDGVGRLIGPRMWIPLTKKYGSKPILKVACTVSTLAPFSFLFINSNNYMFLITIVYFVTSVSYAGVELGTARALFKTAPRKNDAYYLSSFSSMVGLVSAIGPIFAGFLIDFIQNRPDIVLNSFLTPVKYAFLLSFVMRVLSLALINKLYEPRARTVDDVLIRIRKLRYFSFFLNIYGFAYHTSKLVLIPQKQLFIIQRKTTKRLRDDVENALLIMATISYSLHKLANKNMTYYKMRIKRLQKKLKNETKELSYAKGTFYEDLPRKALAKINNVEKTIESGDVGETITKAKQTEKVFIRLRKKLQGAYERNIK